MSKCLEYPSALSAQLPWVPEFFEFQSVSSTRMSWVAEYASAYRVFTEYLSSVQMEQNFGSLFVRINKFVKNAALTHNWMILVLNLLEKNRHKCNITVT